MGIQIHQLKKKDFKKAIQFAIKGMHFNLYLDNRAILNLYGRYFWYDELNRATQVIAAYAEDELAGVLLAELEGEEKKYGSWGRTVYIRVFEFLQNLFYKGGVGVYEAANSALFKEYQKNHHPDGQILFLAANPAIRTRGIGSTLLKELEHRARGKEIYLYTDDACTYPFYEHRGFTRAGEKEVLLDFGHKKVPLKCFLYSKRITDNEIDGPENRPDTRLN